MIRADADSQKSGAKAVIPPSILVIKQPQQQSLITLQPRIQATLETFRLKKLTIEQTKQLSAQRAIFSAVYGNTEGATTGDGSKYGGVLLRSVFKVFRDKK